MNVPSYCTQNDGRCSSCSLSNFGRDCMNNVIVEDGEKFGDALLWADDEFVDALLWAYENEKNRVRRAFYEYRICQLMLKGVAYERKEMRKMR